MSEIKRRDQLLQRVRRECYDDAGEVMSNSLVLDLLMDVDAKARDEERERCAKYKDGLTESMKAIDSMQKRHSAYRAATEKGIGLARLYLNAGETMRAIKALNDACDQMDEADRIRALSDTDERTEK